ncbi:hypothetical protein TorRG33x02_352560 [Trema orientale]|uniref:Uncharacterized protein n=1 Tax=Trema orientale TaxID=63057 RepID=A0A2P5AE94_TREOI|nr:hypothetical protein TorRG33x02_352560 [Trema orientale]
MDLDEAYLRQHCTTIIEQAQKRRNRTEDMLLPVKTFGSDFQRPNGEDFDAVRTMTCGCLVNFADRKIFGCFSELDAVPWHVNAIYKGKRSTQSSFSCSLLHIS